MSYGVVRTSLIALRTMSVAALLCVVVAGFAPLDEKWRSFVTGIAAGILLALVVSLFRAPRAEVEPMPYERPR